MLDIKEIAKKARNAGYDYSILDTKSKNEALYAIADELDNNREAIFSVNKTDVENARNNGLNEALVDRLTLTDSRFREMVEGVRKVATLDDLLAEFMMAEPFQMVLLWLRNLFLLVL